MFLLQSLNLLPFHISLERLKVIWYRFISISSKYHFKTGTLCLLFLSSLVFTALEFYSSYFGIPIWKIVKPRDHNEIKLPIRKIFRKYKRIRHYFVMSRKYLSRSFINKVYDNCNKVSYLPSKRVNNAITCKPLSRRNWTFPSKLDLSEAIDWQLSKSLSLRF